MATLSRSSSSRSYSSNSSSSSSSSSRSHGDDGSSSILVALDDEALVEVLWAAKDAGVLGLFASSSKQLCSFARSRIPVKLCAHRWGQYVLLVRSSAYSVPPFIACTHLDVSACLEWSDLVVIPMMQHVGHLTGLQHINMEVYVPPDEQLSTQVLDTLMDTVIGALPPPLLNLRSINLHMSAFGAHCARNLAGLVQLTALCIQPSTGYPAESTAVAADLTALSRLTNLRELRLWGPPPVQPAAGPGGPFALPSSLTFLDVGWGNNPDAVIGCWVTHLPGCPQLQQLYVLYNHREHSSAHPAALLPLLAEHNRQLRGLSFSSRSDRITTWGVHVAGLPEPIAPTLWRPDAALAALTGLESLTAAAGEFLEVPSAADGQYLAQLSALTLLSRACMHKAPSELGWASLALRDLRCDVALGGSAVGELLLACPRLQYAAVHLCRINGEGPPAPSPPGATPLCQHARLKHLGLFHCSLWGDAAAAQFAQLAPVLSGVPSIGLHSWPQASSSAPGASSPQLPDLAPYTALSELIFHPEPMHEATLVREDVLLMLAPVPQLRRLILQGAQKLTARVAVSLQFTLPQLQYMKLEWCGMLLPDPPSAVQQGWALHAEQDQEQDAEQMVAKVRQLLRPGLVLELFSCTL